MINVDYPIPQFRSRTHNGQQQVFDVLRKQWVKLSPEEWVRQNFIQYLIQRLQYPKEIIAVEKELLLNGMKRRFDLLLFNKEHQPWMLIECKAQTVPLQAQVLEQVLRYNISLPVPYLVITNGAETKGWKNEGGNLLAIDVMPQWDV